MVPRELWFLGTLENVESVDGNLTKTTIFIYENVRYFLESRLLDCYLIRSLDRIISA